MLKISDEELPTVTGELFGGAPDHVAAAKMIAERFKNLKLVVITRGENGSLAYDVKEKRTYFSDAVKVKVVSTVGAGDSFSASLMYNYLSGKNVDECLRRASVLSAYVVSRADAIPEYDAEKLY